MLKNVKQNNISSFTLSAREGCLSEAMVVYT
jgi:hypothetical protein